MNPIEISAVATNPGITPALHIWGWEIAVYLFLGGLVAGLLVISGLTHRRAEKPPKSLAWRAPALAPVLLSAGMFALFLDLEHKLHFFRFYTTFEVTSPMSWGAWILMLVYPASVLFALGAWAEFGQMPDALPGWLEVAAGLARAMRRFLATANVVLGVALGMYTGILLGTLGARPLWNTPLLGPLFLLSGLSGGAALLALMEPSPDARQRLAALDLKVMGAEAATLLLILIGLGTGGAAQRASAHLFLGGDFTALFWIAIVIIGLALPAAIELLHRRGAAQATAFAPVLVLIGGLALRAIFLLAGQASHWETL